MSTARAALRDELSARLLPELRRLGFDGPSRVAGHAPTHVFSRPSGLERHVLTLQLEKRGLPRFVLGLAVEPPEGFAALTARGGSVVVGQLRPGRGAGTGAWFRADPTLWRRLRGRLAAWRSDAGRSEAGRSEAGRSETGRSDAGRVGDVHADTGPVEAVRACLALLPDVERWWRHPEGSRHIVVHTVRYPGTGGGVAVRKA